MANKRHTPTQSSFLSKQGLNIVSRKEDLSTMAARPTTLIRQQHTMDLSTQHRPRWERWETRRPSLVLLPSILTTPRWSTTCPTFPPLGRRPAPNRHDDDTFLNVSHNTGATASTTDTTNNAEPHQRACVHLQSLLRVGPLPKAHSTL